MEFDNEGKFLLTESMAGRLYVYWEEWKSNRFLHIRFWYQKDGVWKPGMKGVAIPEAYAKAAAEAVGRLVNDRA